MPLRWAQHTGWSKELREGHLQPSQLRRREQEQRRAGAPEGRSPVPGGGLEAAEQHQGTEVPPPRAPVGLHKPGAHAWRDRTAARGTMESPRLLDHPLQNLILSGGSGEWRRQAQGLTSALHALLCTEPGCPAHGASRTRGLVRRADPTRAACGLHFLTLK